LHDASCSTSFKSIETVQLAIPEQIDSSTATDLQQTSISFFTEVKANSLCRGYLNLTKLKVFVYVSADSNHFSFTFLGPLATLRKATISFGISVSTSVYPLGTT
jgi:hypothetical protein